MIRLLRSLPLLALAAAACRSDAPADALGALPASSADVTITVRDTVLPVTVEASGIAAPVREATLSTKLMGSITEVLVHEGQAVAAGEVLARIDARDIAAKGTQTDAGIAQAEASYKDALAQTERIRALYADSAAPKAMLDDAEAGLARAEAGVRGARGAGAEVQAARAYADVRAPFNGVITKRFVDPGAFVAPGSPVVAIQDASRLRISVSVAPSEVRRVARGARLSASVEGQAATAIVEGVVPAAGGAMYTVNAIVDNAALRFQSGGSAVLLLPQGERPMLLVPVAAIVREGDLTGVRLRAADGSSGLRWLQVGREWDGRVEVLSGLRAGEVVVIPPAITRER
jgi:RND family efflux transporter MFP subunit